MISDNDKDRLEYLFDQLRDYLTSKSCTDILDKGLGFDDEIEMFEYIESKLIHDIVYTKNLGK